MQKSHPFGIAEKRFNWVEIYCNGNDLTNHKKLFSRKKDNLEGGIGYYFSRIKLEEEKEKERDKNLLKYTLGLKRQKKMKNKYHNFDSQRVLLPEKNTEIKKINKKRTYEDKNKSLLYSTNGSMISLFKKTPLLLRNKGIKINHYSVDFSRKKETDFFAESFLNDKSYNRIPGVDRKNMFRIYNDGGPMENIKYGRRHFPSKSCSKYFSMK
jgi:hypothetical protein